MALPLNYSPPPARSPRARVIAWTACAGSVLLSALAAWYSVVVAVHVSYPTDTYGDLNRLVGYVAGPAILVLAAVGCLYCRAVGFRTGTRVSGIAAVVGLLVWLASVSTFP
jgi:hypothetical protein